MIGINLEKRCIDKLILFMIIRYRIFGLIADFAIVFNIILLVSLLSLIEATLTMPGIAGIVLTVGMAVDANVLVFERIKEELRSGRSIINSIDLGYKFALKTILDANFSSNRTILFLGNFFCMCLYITSEHNDVNAIYKYIKLPGSLLFEIIYMYMAALP